MISCSFSSFLRMSASPYFTVSGRKTRSAARGAIAALSTKEKSARKHVKIEYEEKEEAKVQAGAANKSEDVAAKKRKKDTSKETAQSSGWEPANWREQLDNIREMRKARDAPVDSQGCEKTADVNQSPEVRGILSRGRVGKVRVWPRGHDSGGCPREREIRLFPDSFDVAGSNFIILVSSC